MAYMTYMGHMTYKGHTFIFHEEKQDFFAALDLFSERVLYFEQRTIFGAVSLAEILKSHF